MAGIEIEEDYLHDAIVDIAASRGVGVNGFDLTNCRVRGGGIRLQITNPFDWKRRPVVVFRHANASRRYRLEVNGADAGSWTGRELDEGIPVTPAHIRR